MAKVFITFPVYRYSEPESDKCLSMLIQQMMASSHKVGLDKPTGESMITRVRNRSLSRAIRDGSFDWVLHLDSDIVFTPDLFDMLMLHKKDVIGAVYRVKDYKKPIAACAPLESDDVEWKKKSIDMNCVEMARILYH